MPEMYEIADAILEVAPHLEQQVRSLLQWYRRNGNVFSGVQEFKELYVQIQN